MILKKLSTAMAILFLFGCADADPNQPTWKEKEAARKAYLKHTRATICTDYGGLRTSFRVDYNNGNAKTLYVCKDRSVRY